MKKIGKTTCIKPQQTPRAMCIIFGVYFVWMTGFWKIIMGRYTHAYGRLARDESSVEHEFS